MKYATYRAFNEMHMKGTFFVTHCCRHIMYSVSNDYMAHHGKLCPKCLRNGKQVTLFLQGTDEANEVMKERGWIE